jgi:hypothetical protein
MPIRRFNTMLLSQNKQYGVSSGKTNLVAIASGGNISYVGGYTIHTFTSDNIFSCNSYANVEYLIIAGGTSGDYGYKGGGGAGGYLTGYAASNKGNNSIVVGLGGTSTAAGQGSLGGDSSAFGITSFGGGSGYGTWSWGAQSGVVSGILGQGNDGGPGFQYTGGGGGGAGGAGFIGNANSPRKGGNGGNGLSSSISGSSVTYAGGGGGGTYYGDGDALGGSGGGGTGKPQSVGLDATYYGSGGGGGGISPVNVSHRGGSGYQGIVIIRYIPEQFTWE